MKRAAEKKLGKLPSEGNLYWTGLRPVSPDDLPILGRIPRYKNLFVNAGQGSKGMTLSFGSAKILSETMQDHYDNKYKDYSIERFYF